MIYENYEQFVEYLNSLETDKNKLNTIFKYVLEKVHYNYDILTLAKIQANENWEFERYIDIENQQQRNEALKNLQKKYGFSSESFSLIDESYGSYQIIEGRRNQRCLMVCWKRAFVKILLNLFTRCAMMSELNVHMLRVYHQTIFITLGIRSTLTTKKGFLILLMNCLYETITMPGAIG